MTQATQGHRPQRRDGLCNQKGGAGKTTSCVGVGASLAKGREAKRDDSGRLVQKARLPQKVRMHDMDPQAGSLTFWLPPQWDDVPEQERYDMSHVLRGECTLDQATWPTTVPNLYIVPSWQTLNGWVNERPIGAERALCDAMDQSQMDIDAELVDCPPSLNLLTITSLVAIRRLFVPLRASGLDMEGVAELGETVEKVQAKLNSELDVAALVLCGKLESRLTQAVYERLQADYPDAVTAQVRNTVRVQEAPFSQQTLIEYAPEATATVDYDELTDRLYPQAA